MPFSALCTCDAIAGLEICGGRSSHIFTDSSRQRLSAMRQGDPHPGEHPAAAHRRTLAVPVALAQQAIPLTPKCNISEYPGGES